MEGVNQQTVDDWFNQLNSPHNRKHCSLPSCQFHFNLVCDGLEINTLRFPLENRAPKISERNIRLAKTKQTCNHLRTSGCHSSRVKATFIVVYQLPQDRCITVKNMKKTSHVFLSTCTENHHIIRIQYVSGDGNATRVWHRHDFSGIVSQRNSPAKNLLCNAKKKWGKGIPLANTPGARKKPHCITINKNGKTGGL